MHHRRVGADGGVFHRGIHWVIGFNILFLNDVFYHVIHVDSTSRGANYRSLAVP